MPCSKATCTLALSVVLARVSGFPATDPGDAVLAVVAAGHGGGTAGPGEANAEGGAAEG